MALTFRAASGANLVAATPVSQTCTLPTGTTTGDLTYFCVSIANVVTAPVLSGGTGWTILLSTDATGTSSTIIGYKTITAGEVDPTVSWTTAARVSWVAITLAPAAGQIAQHSGYATVLTGASATTHTPNSYAAGAATGASVLLAGPRVTTSLNGVALTNTPGANYTEPTNGDQSTASGNFRQISAWTGYRLAQTGTIAPTAITHSAASSGLFHHAFAVEVAPPILSISTLTEDFATQDAAKWTYGSGTSVVGGQAVVNCTSAYPTFDSNASYNLTGAGISAQFVSVPALGNSSTEMFMSLELAFKNNQNQITVDITPSNTILPKYSVGGVTTNGPTTTYNSAVHKYFKIRESSGTTYWDYSTNGLLWFNLWSHSNPFAITSLYVEFGSGYFGTETAPGNAVFDNVNLALPARVTGSSVATTTTNNTIATMTAAVPIGTLVMVSYCSWGFGGSAPVVTIADSKSNTWVNHVSVENGTVGVIQHWSCVLTTAFATSDTITVNSVGTVALNDYGLTVDYISGYTNIGAEVGALTTATSTTPSVSLTPTSSAASALIYGALTTMTTAPTITEDADTAGGDAWHSATKITTATASRLVQVAGAFKVATPATTAQTYNPTLNASQLWESYLVSYPLAPVRISAVGSLVYNVGTALATLAVSPTAVGNVLCVGIRVGSPTVNATALSGGGVTTWTLVNSESVASNQSLAIFYGRVTTAGSSTITATYNGSVTAITNEICMKEYVSQFGTSTVWTLDVTAINDNVASGSTTITWPSLTPTKTTPELYFGMSRVSGSVTTGGSSGTTTYELTGSSNVVCSNTAVSAALQPTWTQTSGFFQTMGMILNAGAAFIAPKPYQLNRAVARASYW